ncbi:MAG: ABC transporter ATP-binding protein/permease [Oscillospiraceae bacterium]|nr:ABC transporter ATP-binding protein/permease [Oscillospiraceae bacterium]
MLELKEIIKDYPAGNDTVHALKGIDLAFRSNEFVSILGPSGCGKTTLLNIIGGLDGYTSGDLIINGTSTKKYKDRDWDTYRNHSVGFVFQNYNLIPHQTVLKNVELALSLSGARGKSRRQRAEEALTAVGLGDQFRKRPAEMSGGQMQRVAIARALVNDPEIILLDEPTGALDTETGIMVMEILKKVAADRLVVMVTHNPDLAERYSTRIVRMLDGKIISDSRPLGEEEKEQERQAEKEKAEANARKKMPRMKLTTAFGLSLNNLFTKRKRTILTSMAGSIGIVGIALIYAVSRGTENYIDSVQEDALSSYPLTITAETADMSSMMTAFAAMNSAKGEDAGENSVEEVNVTASVFQGIGTNDLRAFKEHLENTYSEIENDVNTVRYTYPVTPRVYAYDVKGDLILVNPSNIMGTIMGGTSASSFGSMMSSSLFSEMMDDPALINEQYETVAGRLPERYDELLMVLTDKAHITDFLEYVVGLKDVEELSSMVKSIMSGEATGLEYDEEKRIYTYDELLGLDLRLVNVADLYRFNSEFGVWEDMSEDKEFMKEAFENAERLKVVGIVAPAAGSTSNALSPGICYLPSLTLHVMEQASGSEMVANQLLDSEKDVISGKTFDELNKESGPSLDLDNMISVDTKKLSSAFSIKVDTKAVENFVKNYVDEVMSDVSVEDSSAANSDLSGLLRELADGLTAYIVDSEAALPSSASLGGAEKTVLLKRSECQTLVSRYLASEGVSQKISALAAGYELPNEVLDPVIAPLLTNALSTYISDFPSNHGDIWARREELAAEGITVDGDTAVFSQAAAEEIRYQAGSGALASSVVGEMAKVMTAAKGMKEVRAALNEIPGKLTKLMAGSMRVNTQKIASAFKFNLTEEELTRLMSAYSYSGSQRSYEGNLRDLGYSSPDEPNAIIVYLKDFDGKEDFIQYIDRYNKDAEEKGEDEKVIRYTDMTGVLMASVKTILDAITYVLIAFVSISLIVSSIMIGVITLISVQERTKEIGILRAIGASKYNVSSMFNAETVIIGFLSGIIGTGVTYLLCIPINALLHKLTNIDSLSAVLPLHIAAILVAISTMLTLFAGIIPSAGAAKKDPVVALRTE